MGILDGWRALPPLRPRARARASTAISRCPACGSEYCANSAPAVQGVLERDGRVLLAKRAIEPRLGYWDLPGGFLEEGEEPLDGLRREFREETGLEVEPVEWLGAFLDPYNHYFVLGLTWVVHADGEPRAADDVAELRLVRARRAAGRDGVREPGARAARLGRPRRREVRRSALRGCYAHPRSERSSEGRADGRTRHVPPDRGRPGRGLARRLVASGVEAIEEYLAKHLAFLAYLDDAAGAATPDGPEGPSESSTRAARAARRYSPSLRPSERSSAPFGIAPTADACGSPFSNRTIIGIDATP